MYYSTTVDCKLLIYHCGEYHPIIIISSSSSSSSSSTCSGPLL